MKSNLYRMALLSGVVGLCAAQAALADDANHKLSTGDIAVSYADLNLASATGLDMLYTRVQSAAYKVCGVRNMKVELDIVRKNRACVAGAIESAIGAIDNPRLTALHHARQLETNQS